MDRALTSILPILLIFIDGCARQAVVGEPPDPADQRIIATSLAPKRPTPGSPAYAKALSAGEQYAPISDGSIKVKIDVKDYESVDYDSKSGTIAGQTGEFSGSVNRLIVQGRPIALGDNSMSAVASAAKAAGAPAGMLFYQGDDDTKGIASFMTQDYGVFKLSRGKAGWVLWLTPSQKLAFTGSKS